MHVGLAVRPNPSVADREQLIALGREVVATPSMEVPRPILITQRQCRLDIFAKGGGKGRWHPATVKLSFKPDAPNRVAVRHQVLHAQPAPGGPFRVTAHTFSTVSYVANQDGFSTQRKQGVGTCDHEMVNAFAVRTITKTNSKSMRHVDTICFMPGALRAL